MSNRFVAQPDVLKSEGISILDKGQQFKQNVDKIYSTINEMLSSSYMSPAAVAIARQIETYRDELNKMTKTINDYGNYCVNSANTIVRNEQNIIDNTTSNSGLL